MILTCVRCGVDYSGYPYSNLCPECEIWWKGLREFQKEPNPHYGHSIFVFNTEKERE